MEGKSSCCEQSGFKTTYVEVFTKRCRVLQQCKTCTRFVRATSGRPFLDQSANHTSSRLLANRWAAMNSAAMGLRNGDANLLLLIIYPAYVRFSFSQTINSCCCFEPTVRFAIARAVGCTQRLVRGFHLVHCMQAILLNKSQCLEPHGLVSKNNGTIESAEGC